MDNSQILNNKINSIKRDYDKELLIIRDYSSFFTGTQYIFAIMFSMVVFATFLGFHEALIIFFIIVIPSVLFEYYYNIKKFDCKIKFKNSDISFIVDDNIERIIDANEILKYICKLFWKTNAEFVNIYFCLFVSAIILIISIYVPWRIIFLLIYGLICGFLLIQLGNIIHKMFIYFFINKSLYGFRIFPILIIEKPIIEKTVEKEIVPVYRYGSDFKCYYIYFYNNAVYEKVREYFLQNLSIDIDKTKKTISII